MASKQAANLFVPSNEAASLLSGDSQEPFQLIWRQLAYEVRSGSALSSLTSSEACKTRLIFENLNGFFKSGQIFAILGPSGAGKTSLLNAICGRVKGFRGSLELAGGGNQPISMSIISQKDYLIERLTVRETLLYSSRLLNTDAKFDHEANILRVVEMLNLTNCVDSRVCKISGGEYKRVSIAQELLRQPHILVLDEPTSGLDSLNCKRLLKSLIKLVEASRAGSLQPLAVVVSIHQPDVDIFQMFDRVYCMAPGGRVIFDGHPSQTMSVLRERAGFSRAQWAELEPTMRGMSVNPANLLIEIASGELYGEEPIEQLARFQREQFHLETSGILSEDASEKIDTSSLQKMDNILTSFTISAEQKPESATKCTKMDHHSARQASSASASATKQRLMRDKRLELKRNHAGHFWSHTNILTRRAFTASLRDPLMTFAALGYYLCIPFVFWAYYSREVGSTRACPLVLRELDIVSMSSNETISKLLKLQEEIFTAAECSTLWFVVNIAFSMVSLAIAALVFPLNMHVLLKEVRNGWYNLSSYVLAKTFASLTFEVAFPTVSVMMIYVLLDMPSSEYAWRLWAMAFVMSWMAMISHTQGLIFGALFMNSVEAAIFLAGGSVLPHALSSGFAARVSKMPAILQKLSWLSTFRYSSDAINMIRFGFDTCTCDERTEEYLAQEAHFRDVPSAIASTFVFYLKNEGPELENSGTDNTSLIPGVSYELILNSSRRADLLARYENEQLDLFNQLASLMSSSFSYGRKINECKSLRSEILTQLDTPREEWLPMLFLAMLGMLAATKLALFVVVKYKIGKFI